MVINPHSCIKIVHICATSIVIHAEIHWIKPSLCCGLFSFTWGIKQNIVQMLGSMSLVKRIAESKDRVFGILFVDWTLSYITFKVLAVHLFFFAWSWKFFSVTVVFLKNVFDSNAFFNMILKYCLDDWEYFLCYTWFLLMLPFFGVEWKTFPLFSP